jgi:TolB-like protein/Flp pilus assembly protein TadD
VLPFTNLSADKENEYFSDGLAEEIINALTKLPGLRVPARTSSFAFRGKEMDVGEIGAKLRVGHVLEGSVRKADDRIRVTAQLINVSDGYHLWSERYDRRMADVFDIQDEIAQAIVDKLRVQLVGEQSLVKRHTANLEAYNLYLKGRHWWNQFSGESLRKAAQCFERATAEDPEYALPYAALAVAYGQLAAHGWARPHELMPVARECALKALALDETLAEAHWALATVRHWYEWDWRGAESEYRRAIALSPRDASAHLYLADLLMNTGRTDDALAEGRQALELEPVSVEVNRCMIYFHYVAGQFEEAIAQGLRTVELHPRYPIPYLNLGLAYACSDRYQEAIDALQTARALAGADPFYEWGLGVAYARSGRRAEAREIVEHLEQRRYSLFFLAWLYGALGEPDRTFALLETAYEEREGLLKSLKVEPTFAPLRSDPRFADLLRRIGLEA